MEISDEWCLSRFPYAYCNQWCLISINHMDNAIKCILSKSADDKKMSGVNDMSDRQDAIQRDLEKLKKRGCVKSTGVHNILNINADCKIKRLREALWRKTWGTGGWKSGHEMAMCAHSIETKPFLCCINRHEHEQVSGSDSVPLSTLVGVLSPLVL